MRGKQWSGMLSALGFSLFICAWWIVAEFSHPLFVPSPWLTVMTAIELARTGFLQESILMSLGRIMGGWLLGCALGIPLGLLMGWLPGVRAFATPYIQGLRYIPPISFVGIFIVWFGLGEASKIMLVFYTSFFVSRDQHHGRNFERTPGGPARRPKPGSDGNPSPAPGGRARNGALHRDGHADGHGKRVHRNRGGGDACRSFRNGIPYLVCKKFYADRSGFCRFPRSGPLGAGH